MNPRTTSRWLPAGLVMAFLFYLSLFPYRFDLTRPLPSLAVDWPRTDGDWMDACMNLVAYLPLGVAARIATGRGGALMLGAALSFAVEVLQAFLPGRNPSLRDWILNAGGTWLGYEAGAFVLSRGLRWAGVYRPLLQSRVALAAWIAWLLWLAFPFLPLLRRHQWKTVQGALSNGGIDWERAGDQALLIAALLLLSPLARRWSLGLAAAAVLASAVVYRTQFGWADVAGWAAAPLLAGCPRVLLAALWAGWLLWKQFHGIPAASAAVSFGWLPFAGVESLPYFVARSYSGKFLLYGAGAWALARAGFGRAWALGSAVTIVAVGEWAQLSLPGRTPEISDPLLACLGGWFFVWGAGQQKEDA